MKNILIAAGFVCLVGVPQVTFAQNTVKLLEPVNIAISPADPVDFATKQLYLQCGANPTGQIEGPFAGSSLIVDNFIQVQSPDNTIKNYCPEPFPDTNPGELGCFTLNPGDDPAVYPGQPVQNIYGAVGPQDISASLQPGLGLYTFSLIDFGYTLGSSELFLNTSCTVKDKVCHVDNGKKGVKTLTVGAAAILAHLNHGDTLGPCSDGK